jgi:hypothetical protein
MSKSKDNEWKLDIDLINTFIAFREQWIRKTIIDKELIFEQSSSLFDNYIIKTNFYR